MKASVGIHLPPPGFAARWVGGTKLSTDLLFTICVS
jgi:hypothetical protein